MKKILIIEDDREINNGVGFNLKMDGFMVYNAFNIKEGHAILKTESIDLILLDVNLPDGSGFDFCMEIRKNKETPIVFLTACDLEVDQIIGFKVGGDDYIVKPFSIVILRERINAILRRSSNKKSENTIKSGVFTLNLDNFTLKINEESMVLPKTEFKLMKKFMCSEGKVLSRNELLRELWDEDVKFVEEHTLTVNINRLRGKLKENNLKSDYIKTVYGLGYRFKGELNEEVI